MRTIRWSVWVAALIMATPIYAQSARKVSLGVNEARVSVERLIKLSEVDALAKTPAEKDVATLLARERIDMYVTGVRDLGEGREWCIYTQSILPHEVIDRVMTELQRLPAEAQKENAARAIGDMLTRQYPCH
jgi:Rap1a immunity proteins